MIEDASEPNDESARAAEITIRRSLGTRFDGVDFASMDEEAIGERVLANLMDHAAITVRLETAGTEP